MDFRREAVTIAVLVTFFINMPFASAYDIIQFSTLPPTITTNLQTFSVIQLVPSTTIKVLVNDRNTFFNTPDSSGEMATELVDLNIGQNTLIMKVYDRNGAVATYSKQVTYDPNFSTAGRELLYVNSLHYYYNYGARYVFMIYTVTVIDVGAKTILGVFAGPFTPWGVHEGEYAVGITKDGAELILTDDNRYSTASNTNTGKKLPNYSFVNDPQPVILAGNGKLFYKNYRFDIATNSIDATLPQTIGRLGSITRDGSKIFIPTGYIDTETNKFSPKNYIPPGKSEASLNRITPDQNNQYIIDSVYCPGPESIAVFNAESGALLKESFEGAVYDLTSDIVFSADGTKAFVGFDGGDSFKGGIQILDLATLKLVDRTPLNGASNLAVSTTSGKIYATARCGLVSGVNSPCTEDSNFRGIVEFQPVNNSTGLQAQTVFVLYPLSNTFDRLLFYKPDHALACFNKSQCGADGWVNAVAPSATGLPPSKQADGSMLVAFIGQPAATYNIYTSPDLFSWSQVSTLTANSEGVIQYLDAQASKYPSRYYYAKLAAGSQPTGGAFCSSSVIYQTYRTYSCSKPGTSQSACSYSDKLMQKQVCMGGCFKAACLVVPKLNSSKQGRTVRKYQVR